MPCWSGRYCRSKSNVHKCTTVHVCSMYSTKFMYSTCTCMLKSVLSHIRSPGWCLSQVSLAWNDWEYFYSPWIGCQSIHGLHTYSYMYMYMYMCVHVHMYMYLSVSHVTSLAIAGTHLYSLLLLGWEKPFCKRVLLKGTNTKIAARIRTHILTTRPSEHKYNALNHSAMVL